MKTTKATLKKFARLGELKHKVRAEHSGMIDGMEQVNKDWGQTTEKDIDGFFVSRNFIQKREEAGQIELLNCCYYVVFYHPSF